MSSKAVEAALYHMSRCKMPGFLAPIEFHITEDPRNIGIVAKVTSWAQYPGDPVVTFKSVSRLDYDFIKGGADEAPTEMETQSFEKKVFTTRFVLDKQQVMDKSLYEIADLCNNTMKRCVMELCKGMMDELWEC
jgi:hypothetical protein